MVILALLLRIWRRQTLSCLCRCGGSAAKWAGERCKAKLSAGVCVRRHPAIVWATCPIFCALCVSANQSLVTTSHLKRPDCLWLFICYWKPFFASILPFIPCIDTTIDVLFSCDFLCPQTFLLSCCILVEVNIRTSVASLKLCGKFEISVFFAELFSFSLHFSVLVSPALHQVALFEYFSGSSARWIIALGIMWLPQEKQYILYMQKRSVLIISHFNNSRALVSSSFCSSSWDRAPKCFL